MVGGEGQMSIADANFFESQMYKGKNLVFFKRSALGAEYQKNRKDRNKDNDDKRSHERRTVRLSN